MFSLKSRSTLIILVVVALATAFFIITRNKDNNNLIQVNANKETPSAMVAGDKISDGPSEGLDGIASSEDKQIVIGSNSASVAGNDYFRARIGSYWIYSGHSSEFINDKIENTTIKIKHEVVAISGKANDYLITIKTTNLLDKSVKDGKIELKNAYAIFDIDEFYNYVQFPLKVGSRWAEGFSEDDTEPLRDDGYYQNRINWKLKDRVLGHDCYNIISQTLPDTVETIWCDQIGPIQNTYHHNGSLNDSMVRLSEYHY